MQVKRAAPEFILVQADPPAKSPGGLTLVTEKAFRPTTGKVVNVGWEARTETGVEEGDRILWAKDSLTIVVHEDPEHGNLLILHYENVRAVIE